ncbi:MAG: TetR/AcrR family transcriptional regulator, partial [Gemmatimonadaceae bacterium]
MTTARDHFTRHGLRGTSVGDLARAAGIAKGSFYLFFESKELLFFAVLLEAESEVRETLVRRIDRSFASATQFIEHVLQVQMDLLQSHPL